jgi:lysophospholipid acyltransferase (LPLAT)-like uncharacterized protein
VHSRLRSIMADVRFHRLLYHFVRSYSATFRLRIENEHTWQQELMRGTPVLLCAWHQQFFSAIRHFKNYAKFRPALMISKSRDGSMIATVAHHSGWKAIRGSSSRGGSEALRAISRHLKEHGLAAHIVDGPTGPMGVVKAGAVRMAHLARAAIVPVSVSCNRAIYFNSWDRFMLPLPFSRVCLTFGEPLHLPATRDPAAFEDQRQRLQAIMRPGLVAD